jgi:GTP cyclohydrolase I
MSHPADHLHDLTRDHPGPGKVPNLDQRVEDRLPLAHDWDLALAGVRAMLRLSGLDPDSDGIAETPQRVLDAWLEMTAAPGDPAHLLARTFDVGDSDEMVAVGPIGLTSICEHHLLPFTGSAWVGYIPRGRVVGLSKIPRLVDHYAMRPQVQERLTRQITDALDAHLDTAGSACLISAAHSCMALRGVRKAGAQMVTSSLTGAFRADPAARAEFLALARGGGDGR